MQTPTLEHGPTDRKRGRTEIVFNATIMRKPVLTTLVYERDEEDFGSDKVDNLWGRVGQDRTPTVDLLTSAGKAIIHYLRSDEDVVKILVPAYGERIFVYASPSLINQQWSQKLLQKLQGIANDPGFSFEESEMASVASSGERAELAGSSRSGRSQR